MSGQDPQPPGGGYGPPGGQDPYLQQQYGQGGQRKTNTMAILALVFAFIVAPLGVIFGFVARSQIKRTGEAGSGLALAGIIVGLVAVAFYVLAIVLFVVAGTVGAGVVDNLPTPTSSPTF